MGGGHWIDQGDGTFLQIANAFFVPATAYSAMDLYLMGLAPEEDVTEFFFLQNLVPQGGNLFSADRVDITVDDVAAFHGPRLPTFETSQRTFRLSSVGIVEHGAQPSSMLLERMGDISEGFRQYFAPATGNTGRIELFGTVFSDDFESGDVSRWSNSVP